MNDSQCPICFQIYIQPVSLPCEHCLCKICFDAIIKQSNLECPMCRRRIGSWTRLHTRRGSLVDEKRWEYIKTHNSAAVEARLAAIRRPPGTKTAETPVVECSDPVMRNIAETGEIRKEYEHELKRANKQFEEERAEQELASKKLIKEILAQDEKEIAAFRVANKENKPAASSSQAIPLPMTRRSSSLDSITGEYSRYFKPIARYPRTPPRPTEKDKGYPETIKVTPGPQTVKRLDFASSCSPPDTKTSPGETSKSLLCRKDKSSGSKVATSTAAKQTDHTFLLPLQTILDDHNNDGMTSASSDTTSLSNPKLQISTSSPHIASNRCRSSTERSGATSDTISYRSDISSPEVKRRKTQPAGKSKGKNGFLNNKSTKRLGITAQNGSRETRSQTLSVSSDRGSRSGSGSGNSCKLKMITELPFRKRSVDSAANSPLDTQIDSGAVTTNGHTEPAFVDPDEEYAKKLQEMYNIEKKYNLTAIRGPGSGNEYNTRRRARTNNT